MFDISLTELLLCFVVALIVLGPQKLPAVARTLGRWTGLARVYMGKHTAELERETANTGLGRELKEAHKVVRDEVQAAKAALNTTGEEIKRD